MFLHKKKGRIILGFLKFLESIRTPFGDAFFSICTYAGSHLIIILLFSVNYWCADKNFAQEIGAAFFMSGSLVQDFKITFRVPRPFIADPGLTPVGSALSGATGYSFPSGHSQTCASAMIPAAYEYRKRKLFSALCIVLMLLTMFSRMYLGVHTPLDVFTGFAVAAVCSAVMIYARHHSGENRITAVSWILAVIAVLSAVYSAVMGSLGIVDSGNLADGIKNAGACLAFSAGTLLDGKYVKFEPSHRSVKGSALKILPGLAGAGILLYAPKLFVRGVLVIDGLRYFLAVFWIVLIYPLILKKTGDKI